MKEMMGKMDVAFPNLGIYLENVPQGFEIFGFYIALYGLIIGIAMILGVLLVAREAKVTGQDPEIYWDFAIYAVIFALIGARIYYVIFEWEQYKDNFWSIFNTRNGGMAIYGGVIAAFTTLFIYCKIKKLNPLQLGDTAVMGLTLGQIIGRWGNFTNREVFGEYTDNLFAMRLPTAMVRTRDISESIRAHMVDGTNYIQVHPTFLYESALNAALLGVMFLYRKHKKFQGEVILLYLGGYGIIRYFVEGIRTDQLLIQGTDIAVSQMLGIALFVFSVVTDVVVRVILNKNTKKVQNS